MQTDHRQPHLRNRQTHRTVRRSVLSNDTHGARARACVCESVPHLCCFRLSCRLNVFPQVSQVKVTSSLCVLSWIMRLYGLVNRRWQYLQMNSHLALIFRRNSRRSSASIGIMANIAEGWNGGRSAGTRENDVSGVLSAAHQTSALHSERQIIPTPCVWESNLGQHAETYRPAAPSSHNSPAGTAAWEIRAAGGMQP